MKVVSLKITHMSDITAWSEIFMLQYMCYAISGRKHLRLLEK
jgi:hypothetical protein